MRYVMIQVGGSATSLAGEFNSAGEADAFANSHEIYGTPMLQDDYLAAPAQVATKLAALKELKGAALRGEANRRIGLVAPMFDLRAVAAAALLIKPSSREVLADQLIPYLTAYSAALIVIAALPNAAAVEAYDVVTAPSWP